MGDPGVDARELQSLHDDVAGLIDGIELLTNTAMLSDRDFTDPKFRGEYLESAHGLVGDHDNLVERGADFIPFDRACLRLAQNVGSTESRDASTHRKALRIAGQLLAEMMCDSDGEPVEVPEMDAVEAVHNKLDDLADGALFVDLDREFAGALDFVSAAELGKSPEPSPERKKNPENIPLHVRQAADFIKVTWRQQDRQDVKRTSRAQLCRQFVADRGLPMEADSLDKPLRPSKYGHLLTDI